MSDIVATALAEMTRDCRELQRRLYELQGIEGLYRAADAKASEQERRADYWRKCLDEIDRALAVNVGSEDMDERQRRCLETIQSLKGELGPIAVMDVAGVTWEMRRGRSLFATIQGVDCECHCVLDEKGGSDLLLLVDGKLVEREPNGSLDAIVQKAPWHVAQVGKAGTWQQGGV